MSGGSKKQYKQFAINTLEDALLVLKALIVPVITDLAKFKAYDQEAKELLAEYDVGDSIPADLYDSIHDKILYQQREILRFLADHQSSSFSYIAVRALLVKRKYLLREQDEEVKAILNELLNIRNLSFHNTQSMLVADFESAKKSIPKELAGIAEIKPILNPVVIKRIRSYSWDMLVGFVKHNEIRCQQFEKILVEMKLDYQAMYDALSEPAFAMTNLGLSREVQYVEIEISNQNAKNAGNDIANLSMGIQKGKYDGSDEAFQRLTGNTDDENR